MVINTTNLKELRSKLEKTDEIRTAASCSCTSNCYLHAGCTCSPTWFGYEAFAKAWLQEVSWTAVSWLPA